MLELIAGIARSGLVIVFVWAAAAKLLAGKEETARSVAAFRAVPRAFQRPVARLLPLAELGLAGLIVVDHPAWPFLATGLLVAFTASIAWNLVRGDRDVRCGCFGTSSVAPLSWGHVARNAGLLSAAVVGSTASGSLLQPDRLHVVGLSLVGAIAISLVYSMVSMIRALPPPAPMQPTHVISPPRLSRGE